MNWLRNLMLGGVLALAMVVPAAAKETGLVFVSSEKDNAVHVLDGKTLEVVKRIGTAARPRHLQFDPARTRIFVACGDGDAIDIIDIATLQLTDRITGIDDPELFDFSADGGTLFISLEDDAKLGILDLATYFRERESKPDLDVAEPSDEPLSEEEDEEEGNENEEEGGEEAGVAGLTTIEVGAEPEGILANPDGRTVYVSSEVANLVHVVDLASGSIRANILVGQRPRRFALTPDGRELWVSNELAASVSIIDVASNTVSATLRLEPPRGLRVEDVTPVGITMTADGRTAVIAMGRANHVAFVDVAARQVADLVLVGNRAWNATLNRDGSLLYVANGLSDDMTVIDMERRRAVRSVPVGRVPHTVLIDD
ncbi:MULTISPECIES: beta-propeller fold lactonase family protein [unclassified Minwuia]|uniref:YVTN family beta-propeller repeat protein n=1 Tax=unclassified Minwuia TaxID=2618799 RepID=UPI0024796B3F|nr:MULTISPECIES: beta-propeller fold lactonase family protein [unclassified Minwuia]